MTAIYEYQINGNVSTDLSASASMAFQFIKGQFDRDEQKYTDICKKRKKAVETRHQQDDTNEYKCSNR